MEDYFGEEPEEEGFEGTNEVQVIRLRPRVRKITRVDDLQEQIEEAKKQSLLNMEESVASMVELPAMLSSSQKNVRKYANTILRNSVLPKFNRAFNGFEEDIDEIFRVETSDGPSFFMMEYMTLLEKRKYNEASKLAFSVLSGIMNERKRYFF